MATREEQKQATRARILDAATDLLVRRGYSALTTVAVQEAAGLSRGALLHHFPTIAELSKALVQNLVQRNEQAALAAAARFDADADPVDRALAALYESMTRPAAQAELELWAAARTDPDLAAALQHAERAAGRDLVRVVDELFGPEVVAHPRYPVIRDLTITVLRGTVAGRVLHTSEKSARATLREWAAIVRTLLVDQDPLHP
ncbi:TetR/AcrR family transcriptional regulator [Nocardia rhizosphaerihabitans]|uniref:TetR/AcrR family transcriptional regulator n=1 Tax=Nocardia rhizosphaerihabitans TaxID=1691570 RepID=UPI003670C47F